MQQIRAKNAIVKANAATVHTIIQGNLADTDYSVADANGETGAQAAVNDIRDEDLVLLDDGVGDNTDRPAGMKNPHLTDLLDLVVEGLAATELDVDSFILTVDALDEADYAGVIIVAEETGTANKMYVVGVDHEGLSLGEVYIATK